MRYVLRSEINQYSDDCSREVEIPRSLLRLHLAGHIAASLAGLDTYDGEDWIDRVKEDTVRLTDALLTELERTENDEAG